MNTANDIARKIGLPGHTADTLSALSLPAGMPGFPELMADARLLQPYAGLSNGLVLLRFYLDWALYTKACYEALGIPESVLLDGLKDIAIWAEDYYDKHRIPGFEEWEWVANTLRLKVFRLGRLQFEPSVLGESVVADSRHYPAGTPVLEVHIPAGEPLDPAAVAASLEQAPAFFRTCFHREYSLLRCHSWLLCPQLKELLPEQSRILQFQNLFTVYEEDCERQAEERVFGFLSEDPARYPETTALRKSLKQALLEGRTIGMGKGIRTIP